MSLRTIKLHLSQHLQIFAPKPLNKMGKNFMDKLEETPVVHEKMENINKKF